jgi:hypothetical protein
MSAFRNAWASLLTWVPPPFQAVIALIILLLIITKLVPRVIRGCGVILHLGWTPLLELLTYPEFLITTTFRRYEWRLPPGTYAYGRALGSLAPPGTQLGHWLRDRFAKTPRFPWKTTALVVALLASCWYLTPKVPVGNVRTVMGNVNTDAIHTSSWLATGRWAAATSSAPACPHVVPANKADQKKKGKHKPKR